MLSNKVSTLPKMCKGIKSSLHSLLIRHNRSIAKISLGILTAIVMVSASQSYSHGCEGGSEGSEWME